MASHSSTLAWWIPWREEPGRLQSMGSQRVGHNWATSLSLLRTYPWPVLGIPAPGLFFQPLVGKGKLPMGGRGDWSCSRKRCLSGMWGVADANPSDSQRQQGYTLWTHSVTSHSLRPFGLYPPGLLCPWDSPGKNIGMGSHGLRGIFLTQGLYPYFLCLLYWWVFFYYKSHLGSPL